MWFADAKILDHVRQEVYCHCMALIKYNIDYSRLSVFPSRLVIFPYLNCVAVPEHEQVSHG